jgi:hypothetical protein
MSIEIRGTITHIGETETLGQKGFTKRVVAVQTDEKFPQEVAVELTKDKCQLADTMQVGDSFSASCNIKGRRWQGPNGLKFFVSLEAWKVEPSTRTQSSTNSTSNGQDDIPF